jgi:drug/metabolite transporter (DMT)-like permease
VGDAMALIFTNPLFTIIFAAIFLKHRLSAIKISAGNLTIIIGPVTKNFLRS